MNYKQITENLLNNIHRDTIGVLSGFLGNSLTVDMRSRLYKTVIESLSRDMELEDFSKFIKYVKERDLQLMVSDDNFVLSIVFTNGGLLYHPLNKIVEEFYIEKGASNVNI